MAVRRISIHGPSSILNAPIRSYAHTPIHPYAAIGISQKQEAACQRPHRPAAATGQRPPLQARGQRPEAATGQRRLPAKGPRTKAIGSEQKQEAKDAAASCDGHTLFFALQCRVRPGAIVRPDRHFARNNDEEVMGIDGVFEWVINNPDDIRPYGIFVRDKEGSDHRSLGSLIDMSVVDKPPRPHAGSRPARASSYGLPEPFCIVLCPKRSVHARSVLVAFDFFSLRQLCT